MRKLSVIAIVAACLTLAEGTRSQATSWYDMYWGASSSIGYEDADGNDALAANSQIIIAALHPGVTESQVQADFAAGNASKILGQDFDVYGWAPLGWVGCVPGTIIYNTYGGGMDSTEAACGLVNVQSDVTETNTTMNDYFANKPIYQIAINATVSAPPPLPTDGLPVYSVPSGITEMGIWRNTLADPNGNGVFPWDPAYDNCTGFCYIDDPSYAVVGQYGVPAGPAYQALVTQISEENGWGDPGVWPVAELAYVPLPGDANHDGTVDINDLTVVLAHYGQTGMTWSQGEFTGDGTVDINDLTIVLAHYGQSVGTSAAGVAAVPEPASWAMLAAALSAAAWAVARRGNQQKRR